MKRKETLKKEEEKKRNKIYNGVQGKQASNPVLKTTVRLSLKRIFIQMDSVLSNADPLIGQSTKVLKTPLKNASSKNEVKRSNSSPMILNDTFQSSKNFENVKGQDPKALDSTLRKNFQRMVL